MIVVVAKAEVVIVAAGPLILVHAPAPSVAALPVIIIDAASHTF